MTPISLTAAGEDAGVHSYTSLFHQLRGGTVRL